MPTTIASTQQFIPIAQIKRSVAILKNGGLRAICQVSPVNFALKSQQDQAVLFGQFQNFLNSLTFPIQLVVQSRRLDVFPYLKSLANFAQGITVELLRVHAYDYINFVGKLTELANVMEKKFYCVVPYEASPTENPSVIKKLFSHRAKISISQEQFAKYCQELEQRVQIITGGLSGMGLAVKRLDTQAIIEELYYIYNPEEAQEERLGDLEKISSPIISSSKMPHIDATHARASEALEKPVDNVAYKLNPDIKKEKPLVNTQNNPSPIAPKSETSKEEKTVEPKAIKPEIKSEKLGEPAPTSTANAPAKTALPQPQSPAPTASPDDQLTSATIPAVKPATASTSIDPNLQKDLDAILSQLNN